MEKEKTHWNAMADELVDTWVETSAQAWKGWFDLMGVVPAHDFVDSAKPEFKYVAQRFIDNQELLKDFLQLSFKAWQDIFPKIESGEDWEQTLDKYLDEMRKLPAFSLGAIKISADANQLWHIYLQEVQKFSQLWTASAGSFLKPMGKGVPGTTEPLLELNNLYWNLLYEESFGSLMQSPILGPTREFTGKLLRGYDAWTTLYRSGLDYQVILADIQVHSFEELMRELVSLAGKGEPIKDWKEFQKIWSRVADAVFEEAFFDEDNLKIRGKFLNALNQYRRHEQELMELSMKSLNIPLRSEVDEIHKTIYELRKEVKRLKKTVAKYEGQIQIQHPTEPKPSEFQD